MREHPRPPLPRASRRLLESLRNAGLLRRRDGANDPVFPLPDKRVDERHTVFARMARRQGTPAYTDYYTRWPDRQKTDDRLRSRPELCQPGGKHYREAPAAAAEHWFNLIPGIRPDTTLVQKLATEIGTAKDIADGVQKACTELGAVAAGCAPLDQAFLYSTRGRHDQDYGLPVTTDHRNVVVFLVEMDYDAVQHAPRIEVLLESARQYYQAARIAILVASALEHMGFRSRAQYDTHYDAILPPLAVRAGLGELGRNNILVADRFGSRVRIGAVTTTAPLRHSRPVSLGVRQFCEACRWCADSCPARALDSGPPSHVRGIIRWTTNVERCYGYWRAAGSDCAICMAVCPFSRRNTRLHALGRWLVKNLPLSHWLLLQAHGLLYARRWRRPRKRKHACADKQRLPKAGNALRIDVPPGRSS